MPHDKDRLFQTLEAASAEKPLLILKSRYDPFLYLVRRPMFTLSGILTPFFMLPQLQWVFATFLGIDGGFGEFVALFSSFFVSVGMPLIGGYLSSRVYACAIFPGHLTVTHNWIRLEKTTIPLRHVAEVRKMDVRGQKPFGVADIVFLSAGPSPGVLLTVPDVPKADRRLKKIQSILAGYGRDGELNQS